MTEDRPNLHEVLPRYSLWALAIVMAVCGVVFGILRLLGPAAACMATLMMVVVAVHVFASYVGHRMDHERKKNQKSRPPLPPQQGPPATKRSYQKPNLGQHSEPPKWQMRTTSQATVLGGAMGIVASTWTPPPDFNLAVVAVCMISGAALTGIGSFLIGNLTEQIVRSIIAMHREEAS